MNDLNRTTGMHSQKKWQKATPLLMLAAFGLTPLSVQAQGSQQMQGMDHSKMDHGAIGSSTTMPAQSMPSMDHSAMDHSKMGHGTTDSSAATAKPSMSGMDHSAMDHSKMNDSGMDSNAGMSAQPMTGMDHGDMDMQGGSAPADARDPNAYSSGYTLDTGPYALPGPRQLKLADEHSFGAVLVDRLERAGNQDGNATAYDVQAWFGRDYDKLVIKAEGEVAKSKLQDARTELLWGHAITPYWDTQLGMRYDSGTGPNRSWLAFGFQGLAPYWIETTATAYVGENGRTALRLDAEYDLLLTQKLILQPRIEVNYYGKDDEAREIGSGISTGVAGLRLRYEISRQIAPYIGVERSSKFGNTADIARASGESKSETLWVAGVRFWF